MSINTFGREFRFTTWGESHGPALGATVDGVPPGVPLDEGFIQTFMDRRRPGTSKHTTQRREADQVRILSGVFEGLTTGTPIQLMIENTDQRSKDYGDIATSFRPGHADITYHLKYGHRDYRGGGRSSARETAARVAAGAVAQAVLRHLLPDLKIIGYMVQMGEMRLDPARFDAGAIDGNPFFLPDAEGALAWSDYLDGIRKAQDSVGAAIEVMVQGCPPGLGAPVYAKLDTDLAAAMMSINAVKGVEIGEGMAAAALRGTDNADEIRMTDDGPEFLSNHAGGILGGISTGQDIVVRFSIKPTSSITTPRRSINSRGEQIDLITKGRHDPCVGIRAVPVAEAMAACVILDHLLLDRAQTGGRRGTIG
ncbi:chorismate synthase [Paracoccus sp. 1_MG-2023]|uniref:chorismate synthase n=1 Tax=unclassified Paracoccus (in: a-proteobacteria) TaxID=2688777 RepID=UPI001C08FB0D|nr:chorismate synthase [Paracoccus sp. 1_MG-2023]MBU2957295.1 chorismate synthase [Paracoccus sp. C2R09]MDO6669937.1 chorismate synthase [Paracoccus sp. 1_MG-2023]